MTQRSGQIGTITAEMQLEVTRSYWMRLQQGAARLSYEARKHVAQKRLLYLQPMGAKTLEPKWLVMPCDKRSALSNGLAKFAGHIL